MKKLLLGLGTLASVAAPVAAVIACGSGTTDNFKTASDAQVKALTPLAVTIKGHGADFQIANEEVLSNTEVNGDDVRFTYSTPTPTDDSSTDASDDAIVAKTRITVSLALKEVTKVEIYANNSFNENSGADLGRANQSMHQDFIDAKTALDKANEVPKPVDTTTTDTTTTDTTTTDTTTTDTTTTDTTTTDTTTTDGDAAAKAAAAKVAEALASDKKTEIAKINGMKVSLVASNLVDAADLTSLTKLNTAIQTAISAAVNAVNAANTADELKVVSTTDIETAVTAYETAEKDATDKYATANFDKVKDAGADAIKGRASELVAGEYATGAAKTAYDAFIQEVNTQETAVRGSTDSDDYKAKNAAAKIAIDDKKKAAIAAKALQEQKTTAIKQLLDAPTALTTVETAITDLKAKFDAIDKTKAETDINAAPDKDSMDTIVETYNNLVKAFPAARTAATATTATVTAEAADDTSITVDVIIKTDDFKNHIDGLIAKAIATKLGNDFDAKAGKLKSLTVKITDEDGKTVTKTQSVVNVTGEAVVSKIYSRINSAIDMVSEAIAKDSTLGHDIAMGATDYVSKMEARIDAIDMTGDAVQDANNILVAVGNASVFSATAYKPVFAAEVATKDPKAKIADLLAPYLAAEASHGDIVTKLQAQIDKIGA